MTALKVIKRISEKFKKLRTADKVKLVIAMVMTVALMVAVPTLAWFSYQKKVATMAKSILLPSFHLRRVPEKIL